MNPHRPKVLIEQIAATTRGTKGELPDMFINTLAIVTEIDVALISARHHVIELGLARAQRSLIGMQRAHAELGRLLQQTTTLSLSLDRVLRFHASRNQPQIMPKEKT